MFALGIHYLTGRSASASYRNRKQAEWPPHPARLYAALVATCHERGGNHAERAALRWLASLPPPSLAVSSADRRSVLDCFVPANDGYKSPEMRVLQARHFPSVTPREADVSIVWGEHDLPPEHVQAFETLLPEVSRLGHSSTLVQVKLLQNPPSPNLIPDANGEEEVRVPYEGLLEELEALFLADRRPGPGLVLRYRSVGDETKVTSTDFSEMFLYRLRGVTSLHAPQTLALTDAIRGTLFSRLNGQALPGSLHGHEGDHIAILALPWTGGHGDGSIKGIAFVLPRALSVEQREEAAMMLGRARLHEAQINLGVLGSFALEPLEERAGQTLDTETWTGPNGHPSRRWATVTPLIFGHYPKKGLENAVEKLCIGLPTVTSVEVRPEPFWSGLEKAGQYRQHRPEEPRQRRLCFHVRVTFESPVEGPLLLGKHRHFGMGLFRPVGGT